MKKFRLMLFFILIFITGCRVGPEYTREVRGIPDKYSQDFPSDSSIANIPWWNLFRDTVLLNIIQQTLDNNRNLKAALARMDQARAGTGIVRSNLYPTVGYGIGGNSSWNSASSGIKNDYSAFADVSYTIDVWSRTKRLTEAALQEYLATEQGYITIRMMLVADAASSYFLLKDLEYRLEVAEQTEQTWKSNLNIVETRYKGGFVSEVDLNQAKIQLLEAQTAIQTFSRLKKQTENALSYLMGQSPQSIQQGLSLTEQNLPEEMPAGLPSQLLERRPDIMEAEHRLKAQTERIGAAEALKYPSFTISASTGMNFINPVAGFASLGGQILGPIFNANANKLQVEVEKARTQELLQAYEDAYLRALREVEDAMVAVRTYGHEFSLRKEQYNAAKEALKLSWIRYDGGLTSYLEVLDLERSLFNSQLYASEALQLHLTSMVRLYEALGGGWEIRTDSTGSSF